MSKQYNACCSIAAASLFLASCSTLLPNRNSSQEITPITADTLALAVIDSLATHQEAEEIIEFPAVDSLTIDSLDCDEVAFTSEEEFPHELFHFEANQTTGIMIDEYRNTVIEDLEINLSEWDSHYPADGHVTSVYGWRRNRTHAGIDLKAQTGDNLYAAFDGVVRLSKYYSSFGNCIIIRHYNGLETLYGHASKLLVKVNDVVKAGDVIALAGNTGRSTGSHLHFEVRAGGNHFNPNLILDTDKRRIKDGSLYITMRNGRLFASNNDSKEEREAYILQQLSIRYYTVKSGDVLSRIAANNGTTVATLCRLNGIKSTSVLRIGQRLIVRDGIKPPAATTTSSKTAAATTTQTTKSTATTASAASSASVHVVKRGDTLSAIAKKYGTTVANLCSINGISKNSTLQLGQRIKLSAGSATTSVSSNASNATVHTVKSGDTLSAIAKRYGTTVSKLCSLNGISSTSTLRLGQRIVVK